MTDERLTLKDLEVTFGVFRALGPLNLTVAAGSHVAVLGPSGAGKTTLLRAVAGLVRPTRGWVGWGAECWEEAPGTVRVPPERRRIGLVTQDPALWPPLTAVEHLDLALRWRGVRRSARAGQIRELLDRVRLAHRAGHRPAMLSGGEAQRLALARALVGGSRLLLLDEPLGQLDAALRPALAAEVDALARACGTTVLRVTHDPAEAFAQADLVAVLEGGRLVQCGSPREVVEQPRTRFVAWATGYRNFVPGPMMQTLCHALGLAPAARPFAVLDEGTCCFTPARLGVIATHAAEGLRGRVTGTRYEPPRWLGMVTVAVDGRELEWVVEVPGPEWAGQPVRVVWRSSPDWEAGSAAGAAAGAGAETAR